MRIKVFWRRFLVSLVYWPLWKAMSGRSCRSRLNSPGRLSAGAGIAAMGMGIYNEKTAIADSINLDTTIRWNEYVAAVVKEQRREYVARRDVSLGDQQGDGQEDPRSHQGTPGGT